MLTIFIPIKIKLKYFLNHYRYVYKHIPMSFTQYYFPQEQGMTLRSGKVINCIINSDLYKDLNNMDNGFAHEENVFYTSPCVEVFTLFEFLEEYYNVIRTDTHLSELYYSIPSRINKLISLLNDSNQQCHCNNTYCKYYPFFDLFEQYCELSDARDMSMDYQMIDAQLMETYSGYYDRKTYRKYHLNFIYMRPRPEMRIFIDSPFHDFTLLIRELRHWLKYFNRHNVPDMKKIKTILNNRINSDCAGVIASYLA